MSSPNRIGETRLTLMLRAGNRDELLSNLMFQLLKSCIGLIVFGYTIGMND